VEREERDYPAIKFDMELDLREEKEGIAGTLRYATALFEEGTIRRQVGYLLRMLEAMVADSQQEVAGIDLLEGEERKLLLENWNATEAEYPEDMCIHELFEEQVCRTPEATALVYEEQSLSYAELNQQANQLGHYLISLGVKTEERVAICLERGVGMVVGLLGILKAGGAYVPLDPGYPRERLRFMLEDSGAEVLLTQGHLLELFRGIRVPYMELMDSVTWQHQPETNLERSLVGLSPKNLAYVMYTSGSTGRPKGVAMTIGAVTNLVFWQVKHTKAGTPLRTLQFAPVGFDVSFQEIFSTLCSGGALVLVDETKRRNPMQIVRYVLDEDVQRLFLPYVGLQMFAEGLTDLRQVLQDRGAFNGELQEIIVAGEQLRIDNKLTELFKHFPHCSLENQYGPTETHVATSYRLSSDTTHWDILPPVGRPIANARIYVLDRYMAPVPVGVTGELFIGGEGVGRGYWKRPDLTAERFVPDHFVGEAGARMYRTGDLGRYLGEGNIEFLGRNDQQVKIRGFRIELGEIEARLAEHAWVREAVVVAREDGLGGTRLVAYTVPGEEGESVPRKEMDARRIAEVLREHLMSRVPEYMVPAAYVQLEALPLTPSGKLDRKALPAAEGEAYAQGTYEPPQGEMEEQLAEMWQELLGVERVGRQDRFFELGGHSLLAMRLQSRIRKVFGVELPIGILFAAPALRQLAQALTKADMTGKQNSISSITPVSREGALPLSFAQQRLWFLDQLHPNSSAYNIPYTMRMKGVLNVDATREALSEIVKRHEVLRTTFVKTREGPVQLVQRGTEFRLEVEDLGGVALEEREAEMLHRLQAEADRPFDLESGPVLRARILQLEKEDHVLQVVIHHIATDGWSEHILLQEFASLYAAFAMGQPSPLAEMKLQYGDFAVSQRQWLKGEVLAGQVEYWRKELHGMHLLDLPVDSRGTGVEQNARDVPFRLTAELTENIKQLSISLHATVFMVLTAAFHLLLGWYADQEDVVTGTDVANRNWREVEDMIGFFVNQLVLRTDLSGDPAFSELLQRVRTATLGAYAHQDVPFEKIVEELAPARVGDGLPLFNVKMIMQNTPEALELSLPGLQIETIPVAPSAPRYLLSFTLLERAEALQGILEYPREMFKESSIELFLLLFRKILDLAVANPGIRLNAIREQLHRLKESHQQQKKISLQDELERRFGSAKRVRVALS
jgi:amino acid adenylation domain-containing protein